MCVRKCHIIYYIDMTSCDDNNDGKGKDNDKDKMFNKDFPPQIIHQYNYEFVQFTLSSFLLNDDFPK